MFYDKPRNWVNMKHKTPKSLEIATNPAPTRFTRLPTLPQTPNPCRRIPFPIPRNPQLFLQDKCPRAR
jgi:hypothetical protein